MWYINVSDNDIFMPFLLACVFIKPQDTTNIATMRVRAMARKERK